MNRKKERMFVLGIDGVPFSLLKSLCEQGVCENLSALISDNGMKPMNSVYPVISSVAWTGFATGVNPAQHGIFGFADRVASPFQITIPTSRHRKAESIWTTLSRRGKKVVVMNVPVTYPVEVVNGKMVSCFLCPDIEKGTYPPELALFLKEHDYIIDVDAWLARTDRSALMDQIFRALDARFQAAFDLEDDWNYFHLHIMETDRLMHFFWYDIEDREKAFHMETQRFFQRLDWWIGKLVERLQDSDSLLILSDHGFCGIRHEVQMNTWLREKGYLILEEDSCQLDDYQKETICYSVLPGRFYINLAGREERGSVSPTEYDSVRNKIKQELLDFRDPVNNQPVIRNVFFREEIYSGSYLEDAADIIAHPNDGYDLKDMLPGEEIFTNSALVGMHTYENALIIGKNFPIDNIVTIEDVHQEMMHFFDKP